jgi:predicted Rossmann fold nucleotide-binding protein DprA/Smf involved in DNA uptake
MEGKLVLISPYDPAAGFNVGHAMQRNKVIYALSDAALVVTSDFEKGGTWTGAIEQLEKLHFVPVFVRNGINVGKGNSALLQRGAIPWPDPHDSNELADALLKAAKSVASEPKQEALSFALREQAPPFESQTTKETPVVALPDEQINLSNAKMPPAQILFSTVRDILARELVEPRNETEVARLLSVTKPQAKAWLTILLAEGILEKINKPTRYRTARIVGRLL